MKKRILSFLVAFSMICLTVVTSVGTAVYGASAIEIDTAEELYKIGVDADYPLSGSYKLTADIDLSGTTWTAIPGYFSGVFDGNGHTIFGMTTGSPDTPATNPSGWGMFTELSGTVRNLKLEDIYFNVGSDNKPVGGICGYIREGAVVENVYMSGEVIDITSRQVRVGAVAGSARAAFTVKNCYFDVDIIGGFGATDGDRQVGIAAIVGSTKQTGTISDCVCIGDVTLTTRGYAGALVSEYYGNPVPSGLVVTNSYFAGTVSYPSGTLLNDGVGTVITQEQLYYGYLSGKLSSAWTVESGNPPYLTALGGATAIEIDTAEELSKIGVDANYPLSGRYKLTSDIDLSGTTWKVIGGIFSGSFNGNGHTISGMTTGSPDAPYTTTVGWGMFTELSGTVRNLKLEDLYFNVGASGGEKPVGGICGYIRDGAVVDNVYMTGSITDVTSHQVRVGAIAGSARSKYTISNCYIDVDVIGGYGDTAIDRQASVAGLVGSTKQPGEISDCVYVGDVMLTTGGYAGALVSEYYGGTVESTVLVVTDAYYSGTVKCESGTLLNDGFGTKITVDQLLDGYLSDKLSSAWTVDDGSVPYLKTFGSAPEFDDGSIKIDSAEKLGKIGVDANYPLSGSYKLTSDIDLTGKTWTVIGGVFSGVLDGNGHTISGMTSGTSDAPYTNAAGWGIFTELSGTVKNLKLEDIYFNVGSDNKPVGGICGYIRAGAVVENVYMSGEIIDITSRQVRVGAVAGSARGAFTVRNCYFDVDLTGGFGATDGDRQVGIAAIVGSTMQSGVVSDCVCVGDITLTTKGYAGALVSEYYGNPVPSELVVTNSYFAGALSYQNGNLLNDGVGTVITAEQLLDGSLSDKLSDAWTVEIGSAPYLTDFGTKEMPLEDALTAVKNALDGFDADVGTTKSDILSCARKAVSGTSVSLSIESFTKERPTSEKEGSVTVSVKVTSGGVSETVTKTYSIPKIPGLDYEFTSSVKGRADGTISILLPEGYNNEAYELYWGTSEGVSEKYSSLTTMEDIAVNGNTLTYIPEKQTYIPEGITHLYLTLDGAEVVSFEIPEERRTTLGEAKYTFGVFSDVHFTTSEGKPNNSFTAAMNLYRDAGAMFVVSCGDMTTGGREAEYAQFTSTYAAGGYTMPFWTALGNHDILKWNLDSALTPEQALSNMKAAVNTFANVNHSAGSQYTVTVAEGENAGYDYTMSYGDELFIFMSVGVASNSSTNPSTGALINVDQRLADSQITWLEETLNKYYNVDKKDGQVFLIFHYYTLESGKYYSTATGTEWNAESSAALDGVLREYPGVIHFNGHNHFYFDVDMNMYADEYVSIHVPSLTNPRTSRDGTEGSGTAYENYIVTVYEDYIIVNGVDAYTGSYAPHAMFMIAEDSFTYPEPVEPDAPEYKSFSLTLNRGVSVNVKFTVSEEYLAAYPDTKVVFSNGVEFPALAGTNTYTVNLTPVNIGTPLTVACGGDEIDVSVETYVNKVKAVSASALGLSEAKYNDLITLVDSIVTYGKAAAGKLEGNVTADFAGVGNVTEEGDIFVGLGATLSQSASAKLNVDATKLSDSYTVTITFGNSTLVNNKPIMDYVENGAIYITGIYAANYGDKITVTVYDGADAIASISFTLNEYLNTLNAATSSTAVRNLIFATYNYGVAATKFAS